MSCDTPLCMDCGLKYSDITLCVNCTGEQPQFETKYPVCKVETCSESSKHQKCGYCKRDLCDFHIDSHYPGHCDHLVKPSQYSYLHKCTNAFHDKCKIPECFRCF